MNKKKEEKQKVKFGNYSPYNQQSLNFNCFSMNYWITMDLNDNIMNKYWFTSENKINFDLP